MHQPFKNLKSLVPHNIAFIDGQNLYLGTIDKESFNKIFILSGDGDYKKLVDFLINKNVFGKMLFPNEKFASSLYNNLGREFFDYLDNQDIKAKISYTQKKKAP